MLKKIKSALKNRKFSKLIFLFILFLTIWITFFYLNNVDPTPKVCFEDDCFYVEIVDEENERTQGLMFRESMDEDRGMLFMFDNDGVYPFWMKNTILPLDIIWLNSDKEIVFIKKNAEPHNTIPINPESSALYVLELNAGISEKINISVGSRASFIGVQVG